MTGLREKCGERERKTSVEREMSGKLDDSIFDRSNSVRVTRVRARVRARAQGLEGAATQRWTFIASRAVAVRSVRAIVKCECSSQCEL